MVSIRTKYSSDQIRRMKKFSLVGILSAFGKRTDHYRYMYFSPFRDEKTPSMKIDLDKGLWHDKGFDVGGTAIDLVMRLQKDWCGGSFTASKIDFMAACDFISSLSPDLASYRDLSSDYSNHSASKGTFVLDAAYKEITAVNLISYAKSRRIPYRLISKYCLEIEYHFSDGPQGKRYHALAFPNNRGGYVIRSRFRNHSGEWSQIKICTSSAITTLSPEGTFTQSPTHSTTLVFEGFFNFLSWLQWSNRLTPGCDVVILNSVSNIKKASEWITRHSNIGICLDADEAGDKCLDKIRAMAPEAAIKDLRGLYRGVGLNDFNDYLKAYGTLDKHPTKRRTHISK